MGQRLWRGVSLEVEHQVLLMGKILIDYYIYTQLYINYIIGNNKQLMLIEHVCVTVINLLHMLIYVIFTEHLVLLLCSLGKGGN